MENLKNVRSGNFSKKFILDMKGSFLSIPKLNIFASQDTGYGPRIV